MPTNDTAVEKLAAAVAGYDRQLARMTAQVGAAFADGRWRAANAEQRRRTAMHLHVVQERRRLALAAIERGPAPGYDRRTQ
jgi:hypothetical protein